jgi:hypothetical protein
MRGKDKTWHVRSWYGALIPGMCRSVLMVCCCALLERDGAIHTYQPSKQ